MRRWLRMMYEKKKRENLGSDEFFRVVADPDTVCRLHGPHQHTVPYGIPLLHRNFEVPSINDRWTFFCLTGRCLSS